MKKKVFFIVLAVALAGASFGAQAMLTEEEQQYYREKRAETELETESQTDPETESQTDASGQETTEAQTESETETTEAQGAESGTEPEKTAPPIAGDAPDAPLVAIDPGHQAPEYCREDGVPNGPGSDTLRAGMSPGTSGTVSGLAEYELDLEICLQLRDELVRRGYRVLLTRETQEVSLTDIERCEIANDAEADILIHIHANTSEDAAVAGAMATAPSYANPYVSEHYNSSMKLTDDLLDTYCEVTGLNNRGIYESDNLTSINWTQMPVTVLELGYMTNQQDDEYMADAGNQETMVKGLADGIDKYFGRQGE